MSAHLSVNGSVADSSDGGGGDKISTNTIVRWALAVSGTILTIMFTRWLNHIDRELDTVKLAITEIRREASFKNESLARFEGKLDAFLQGKDDARRRN